MDLQELTAKIIKKYKEYETDCSGFINKAIKIEDRDSIELAIPFNLWEKQEEALKDIIENRLTVILKARQLGLTWLVLAYAVWRMVFRQGYSVAALSKREEPDAKELIRRIKFMLKNLPAWLIREKDTAPPEWDGPVWEATVLSVTIQHPDGEPSVFQSMTASQDSGRSFTVNLVILDEWAFQMWANEIWTAAFPTINRPTGGQVIGLSTNKRGSLFEFIYREAVRGVNGFKAIFLPWYTDPRRNEKWYEDTKKALPSQHLQEYPATPEEAMSAGEGTSFPEFSRDIHVCEPFDIPAWWYRWRSNDPGYTDPFVWLWFAVSGDGVVYVYREFTRGRDDPRVTYSNQAKHAHAISRVGGMDENIAFTVVGRDAFNKHPETGKAIIDYYYESNVKRCIQPPRNVSTDRVHRKAVIHEYLEPYVDENTGKTTARLQIFQNCGYLIETIPLLVNDPHDPEKVADHRDDHPYDALGMGLQAWHIAHSSKPVSKSKNIIAEHKNSMAKGVNKRRLV